MSPAARSHKINPLANGGLFDPNSSSYYHGATTGAIYGSDSTAPAFLDQNLPQYRGDGTYGFGTAPRVSSNARLDSYFNEDFSLLKTFPIHESLGFTFKAEALNAFNRHTFTNVDTNVNSQTFGVASGLINTPRSLQLTGRITF
jgi:hypothetical protein